MGKTINLDDLIKEQTSFTFKGIEFHLNLSFKSMIAFQKWSSQNFKDKDTNLLEEEVIKDLIRIILDNPDTFITHLEDETMANQTRIITQMINTWVSEMDINNTDTKSIESKKK